MYSLYRIKNILGLFFMLSLTACAHERVLAQKNSTFTICAEPESFPLSQSSTGSGYELEVAEVIAKAMNRKLEIKWVAQRDHSYFRQTLGSGQCDALMGVPSQMHNVLSSHPWYRSGFVFMSRTADKLNLSSFDEPSLRKLRIAVPATGLGETPPALALTRRGLSRNLQPYSIYEPASMMAAVKNKEADLAVIWGPFTSGLSVDEKTSLRFSPRPIKMAL